MSVRVQTYVWELQLPPTLKLVAIALADHCHDDGSEARPSQALLCAKTGLSESSVRRALNSLLEAQIVVLERPSGQHRANVYRFPLPPDFAKLRGVTLTALRNPEVSLSLQRCHPDAPEVSQRPPNHKEPLVEPSENSKIVNMEEVKKRNREKIPGMNHPAKGKNADSEQ